MLREKVRIKGCAVYCCGLSGWVLTLIRETRWLSYGEKGVANSLFFSSIILLFCGILLFIYMKRK